MWRKLSEARGINTYNQRISTRPIAKNAGICNKPSAVHVPNQVFKNQSLDKTNPHCSFGCALVTELH